MSLTTVKSSENNHVPVVSVAMGTYNGSKWIRNAIDSILKQTFQDFEIIVCDDASTDDTYSILQELAKSDSRISVIRNDVNSGLNISLNRCIEASKGKYIARMDDDDISHPSRFEKQIAFLDEHPEFALVGCSRRIFDEDGVWGQFISKQEPNAVDVYTSHAFAHPTVMIRKDVLTAVGNYSSDPNNRRGQDYDLWCKLYSAGHKGYNLKEILFDYYESKESISRRKNKFRIHHAKKQLKWRKRLGLPISFIKYPLMEIFKCIVPNSVYRTIRKNKYRK